MNTKLSSVLTRFLKGTIAGALVSVGQVTLVQPTVWADFGVLLNTLGMAVSYGGMIGLLLALHKWASWED